MLYSFIYILMNMPIKANTG